jgi:Sortilin, neurotensin receptor 3,
MSMQLRRLLSLTAGTALLVSARLVSAQTLDSATVAGFRWRTVGPANFMGRLSDVAGIPSPSKTMFVAASGGGIWKTTNNGVTWRPVFDDKSIIAMGMLAIAPSDTNIVWAGTGEPNTRNTIEPGAGIYKSTDGGLTWKLMGLEKTQHIGRIVVDPRNANVVYVAALGPVWKAGPDRGLYKTTDGGATWTMIKAGANDRTGFIDVALDPRNPDVVYAAAWEDLRTPYSLKSGGLGSGLFKSMDAGKTWTEIRGNGFPEGVKGRIGVGISPSNPDVIYTMVEAASMAPGTTYTPTRVPSANGLYRSNDAGKTWTRTQTYNERPFYYSQVRVDPRNPDRVYYSSTSMHISNDGGKTEMTQPANNLHTDTHGLWIDPNDPERFAEASDGGVEITFDKGGNFYYPMNLPIGQFYEVSYDMAVPYNICGGAQDNGAWCGPSRRRGEMNNSYWYTISGGDGFYTAQDPTDPNWIWGESQGGSVSGRNMKTGQALRISKPSWQEGYRKWEDSIATLRGDPLRTATSAVNAAIAPLRTKQKQDSIDFALRFNWNSPYFLSPHNPQIFYFGGNRVLKSLKRGEELFPISADLSKSAMPQYKTEFTARNDTATRWTGGVTLDATGAETYGTVVALAESYVKAGLLLAGTDDGNLWITHNDGATWEEISRNIPGLPGTDSYITRVEPSHFDTLTFYVALERHRWNDFTPYVYMTSDGGRTFRSISSNLPKASPADYLHVVREDPYNRDLLFVGSSIGVYASVDRGASWTRFSASMPAVPVFDLKIHPRDRELIASTHGRGFWLVPIAALEQITPKTLAGSAYLFKPNTAYQWAEPPVLGIPSNGHGQAPLVIPGPPYGAEIVYRVAAGVTGPALIAVSDASGETLFQANGSATPGVHSVTWGYGITPRPSTEPRVQSPAERRDSILLNFRAQMVLDSLKKTNFDSTAIATVQRQVNQMKGTGPNANAGGRGGFGGGGRGAGPGGFSSCEHPLTQWDSFCARPVEVPFVSTAGRGAGAPAAIADSVAATAAASGRGGRGGRARGGSSGDIDPVTRIWGIIGMSPPAPVGGRGGGGGGRGGFGGGASVSTGDYLATLTIGGQTYKQTFRVENTGVAAGASGFGGTQEGHR